MLKNRMIKIIYPLLVLLLLILSVKPVFAEEIPDGISANVNDTFDVSHNGQIFTYRILRLPTEKAQGMVMLTGVKDTTLSGEVLIPGTVSYQGAIYIIDEIGSNAFSGCESITKLVIEEGVRMLRERAFFECSLLTDVTLPRSIISVSDTAFQFDNIIFSMYKNAQLVNTFQSRYHKVIYLEDASKNEVSLDKIMIKPDPIRVQLYSGENKSLSIAFYPYNTTQSRNITWSSNNSKIAKVSSSGKVTAVSAGSATIKALSGAVSATITVLVNPEPPKSIKAVSVDSETIKISWDTVKDVDGYRLVRSTSKNGTYTKVKDLTGTSYTDKSLLHEQKYYYKVYAYRYLNGVRTTSHYSGAASAQTAITVPQGVKATSVLNNDIKLEWNKVTGATGYRIYRASSKNGSYKKVKDISQLYFKDTSVTKGKTYYYKIKAFYTVGSKRVYSAYSKLVSAAAKTPPTPKYVTIGTYKEQVYKILGHPYSEHYFTETDTYEFYYKKRGSLSSAVDTATIYIQEVQKEWVVVGWNNLYSGLKVSDGNENNSGTFTVGSSIDEVAKVMKTPINFGLFYDGTAWNGYTIRRNYVEYSDGSIITYNDKLKVVGWENNGSLKVAYGAKKPSYAQITLGTSLSDIIKAYGTPKNLITNWDKPAYLNYGNTLLILDDKQKLAGWEDKGKIKISIGNKVSGTPKVKVGTAYENVIKALGTPDSFVPDPNHYTIINYLIYGKKVYSFDMYRKVSRIDIE